MNPSNEGGVKAYMAFKLSHAMFKCAPSELDGGQRGKLAATVKRQAEIEARVLSAAEAKDVVVPTVTVDKAVAQLMARYTDEAEFELALSAQGFDRVVLTEALLRELRVEAVLDKISSRSAAVSELDVQLHYQLRGESYSMPARRKVSHILVTINDQFPENTRERALARIGQIRARLAKKPDRFAEQAMKHSECPTAMNGGLLGEYGRGQLFPQLDAVLFEMALGEISAPVESELGFHLLRCDDISAEGVPPFEAVAPRIRAAIEAKRRKLCQRQWLSELMQAEEVC